ncbi:MAG: hypothetical protein CMM78_00550 [Rhodospirillaceae bacterium]|nr:hypothetical protein [Rhodospirillales bacterium]MAX46674.1 hypothetical protein [Rhodospirillaceae bacterium]
MRVAQGTRLRGCDEMVKMNRKERGGGAKGAEGVVGYGIPLLTLNTILILRRRDSAVSKDAL